MGADSCDEEDDSWLNKARDLLPAVAAHCSAAKFCMPRWSMVGGRLNHLRSLLMDVASSPFCRRAALCGEVMESIVRSLQAAQELARECQVLVQSGKLQMQSRIDSLVTILDGHIRDCRLMIENSAPPPGGAAAGKRGIVRDLLSRLQIGGAEQRSSAMDSLVDFMSDDAKNVLFVAAASGGVAALVDALDSGAATATAAAAALGDIAAVAPSTVVVAVAPLVKLLGGSGGGGASEAAARALQSLTSAGDGENTRLVAAQGGAAALVALCSGGTPAAQAAAAGVLRNLSSVEEIGRRILDEEQAVRVLLSLVSSGTPASRENAAATLHNLALNDPSARSSILSNDGVEVVMRYLEHGDAPASQEVGLAAICSLVDSEASVHSLVEAGFLQQISGFLSSSASSSVQQVAADAVVKLAACCSSQDKRAIAEAGCISHLIRIMAEGKTREAQVCAVQALVKLMELESTRKSFCVEDKGISGLVNMLEEDEEVQSSSPQQQVRQHRNRRRNAGAEAAVSGLLMLAGSSRSRKQMVACGAVHRLNALARLEVAGSRRLLDRLDGTAAAAAPAAGAGAAAAAAAGGSKIRNLFRKRDQVLS